MAKKKTDKTSYEKEKVAAPSLASPQTKSKVMIFKSFEEQEE
ncbi:hypothetical protein BH10BAC1_BH10BAC1_09740 [soil metagenome]